MIAGLWQQPKLRYYPIYVSSLTVTAVHSAGSVLAAAKALLRPLVRVMIACGVTLPTLVAALKECFVDVAASDFGLGGRGPSDSRVSLVTGVHRKDVRAIRERSHPVSTPRAGGLAATVVGRWLGRPDHLDAAGRPRPLPRPAFDALVAGVSKDVRPRTVLDELLRLGLVELGAGDTVRLLADAFVPARSGEELLGFFQQNLHDHMAAAAGNLLAGPEERRFLERAVYYNNLRPADIDRLEAEARTLALAALRHLNGLALEMQQAAREADGASERFRFGVYFFRAEAGTAAPAAGGPGENA
ncbi:MAG: hypothetical protein AVDCRST_MAG08-1246 [uncultured Acetobacteraceae bacterium]|uniref:Uncharacterized protein n=1 Tax=uncultured Acetobacteraceae bacterium TaxID=169975 RepID=A0A6J4HW82_9PROT|nr:MAG: hypothetical protein AVDCRST_MAG08-1246 [uncultured Acetobacteraceae bacterium]